MKVLVTTLCLTMVGYAAADDDLARPCTHIVDKMARLACYDRAFGRDPVPLPRSGPPSATDAPPAMLSPTTPKTAEQAFGDDGNLKAEVRQGPAPPRRLTATVTRAVPFRQGLFRLTLDNGQVWETKQADSALNFKASDKVTISRMLLGNYLISLAGGGRTISVRRIQ